MLNPAKNYLIYKNLCNSKRYRKPSHFSQHKQIKTIFTLNIYLSEIYIYKMKIIGNNLLNLLIQKKENKINKIIFLKSLLLVKSSSILKIFIKKWN
jgi:hypothetical protein